MQLHLQRLQKNLFQFIAVCGILFFNFFTLHLQGQVNISTFGLGNTYSDDFTGFDGTTDPVNWVTTDASGAASSNWVGSGPGTGTGGGKYSFGGSGTGATFEGSLGFLPSSSRAIYASIFFTNNTASVINSFTISYVGEHWRSAQNGRNNGWAVEYKIGAGSFVAVPALTYVAPNTFPTGAGPHGTEAFSETILASIGIGETIEIRFFGDNGTGGGSRQGVAIDDFTFTPIGGGGGNPNPEPTNHVSNLSVSNVEPFSADISWIDSDTTSSANPANGYLIVGEKGSATHPTPIDTVPIVNQTDWTNDLYYFNVSNVFGANSHSLSNLIENTTYTIYVYPYSNSGNNIDYKTDGTIPSVNFMSESIPFYDIADVRSVDAQGVLDSLGVFCKLTGVVTSPSFRSTGYDLFIQDSTAGIKIFSTSFVSSYNNPQMGDSIEVFGTIAQFRGQSQISPDEIILHKTNANLPQPLAVSSLSENVEGLLVSLEAFQVVNSSQWSGSGSYNVDLIDANSNAVNMRISSFTDVSDTFGVAPSGFFSIVGVVNQFANSTSSPFLDGYQVYPRGAADIFDTIVPLTCNTPINLSVTNIGEDEATFSWVTGGDNLWNIQFDTAGFAIGTGFIQTTSSNPYTATGLNPSTNYDFYVQDTCTALGGSSAWAGPFTFTTNAPFVLQNLLGADGVSVTINFDNTVDNVNNGWFDASGFSPNPILGQLNSNSWRVVGMSDGLLDFGGTQTSGDFTRGISQGGVTSGGIYSFETSINNFSLGFQPTSTDFANGSLTLRAPNLTDSSLNAVAVAYDLLILNNESRSSIITFSYSTDDVNYTTVFSDSTPFAADNPPIWQSTNKGITLPINLSATDTLYLRWQHADAGSGVRDEFALDNISLTPYVGQPVAGCDTPSVINVSNIGLNSAELSWVSGGSLLWNIAVDTAGFNPDSVHAVTVLTNPYQLSNLQSGTNYEVYVQDSCSGFGVSAWVGPFAFTTQSPPPPVLLMSEDGNAVVVDFDQTVDNVNNGQFLGTGFSPNPAIGQLNSHSWKIVGMSEGVLDFGNTSNTGGDFARGLSSGGTTSGGLYAFEVASGNHAIGVQPTGSDFSNGHITLKVPNLTALPIDSVLISYDLLIYNDQNRSGSILFQYSRNDNELNYTTLLSDTSTEAADASPSWVSISRSISIPISLVDSGTLYLRWRHADVSGSGNRDEFAIDNISITPYVNPNPATFCPNSSMLSAANITSSSAEVTWETGGSNMWNIEYGTSGFALGSGTQITVSNNPYVLDSLMAFTNYDVYVQDTCDGIGASMWLGPLTFTTTIPPCDAPLAITLDTADTSSATISWISGGSNLWNVEYGIAGFTQGSGTLVNTSSNPFTISNLDFGTDYEVYIQDTCVNIGLSSWFGPFAFSTPFPPCEVPSNLQADSVGFNDILISWTSGGSNLWNVEYGLSGFSAGSGTLITTSSNPFNITGLDFGATYDIYIQDTCANVGLSAFSDLLTVSTPIPNCTDATNLVLNFSTLSTAQIDWTSSAAQFNIEYGLAGFTQGSGTLISTSNKPFLITGLTPATDYEVYVQDSCAGIGLGAFTGPLLFTTQTPAVTCDSSSGLTASNINTNSAQLNWVSGGSNLWNIEFGPTGFTQGSGTVLLVTTKPYTLSGLDFGTIYDVYVRDTCENVGVGAWFGPISFTTLIPPCNEPSALILDSIGINEATILWTSGGSNLWNIEYGLAGFTQGSGTVATTNSNPFNITGLDFGTTYEVYVQDTCENIGTSSWFGPISFITALPICEAPSVLMASTFTDSSATILWTSGGSNLWNIEFGLSGFTQGSGTMILSSNNPFLLENLMSGTSYDVYVQDTCENINSSTWIGPISFTTTIPCLSPTQVMATNISDSSATISWTSGGSALWNVQYGLSGFAIGTGTQIITASNPFEIIGLAFGTNYDVYVQDTCAGVGTSNWSLLTTFTTTTPPCDAPANVLFGQINSNSAEISWNSSASLTLITYVESGDSIGNGIAVSSTSGNSFISGLMASTSYDVYLQDSCSNIGRSSLIGPFTFSTIAIPSVPELLSQDGATVVIDFDNSVQDVNNGQYANLGFSPNPVSGQLNSNSWSASASSFTNFTFGASATGTPWTMGTTNSVFSGGLYAFETSTGNVSLGLQPTGSVFNPGFITLRAENNTGLTLDSIQVGYDLLIFNDQPRGNSWEFYYSLDNVNFTFLLADTSQAAASSTPAWEITLRDITIPVTLPANAPIYFRWRTQDVAGSGSRDEFALDNIRLTPFVDPTGPAAQPTNHVTSFAAANVLEQSADLTWVDADTSGGGQSAIAYLIVGLKDTTALPIPADGAPEANDLDWSDGLVYLNVLDMGGANGAAFTNLEANTSYTFYIFPYNNGGALIDYKTDGTVPSVNLTTSAFPDTLLSEDFTVNPAISGNWSAINTAGTNNWTYNSSNGGFFRMNGFTSGCSSTAYLVTGAYNLDAFTTDRMNVSVARGFSGNDLYLKYSNDFDGIDPTTATWNTIRLYTQTGTYANDTSIRGVSGCNTYFAFVYEATGASCAQWDVQHFTIVGEQDSILCQAPSNLTASNDGLIDWVSCAGNTSNLEFGISGFTQGSGTLLTNVSKPFQFANLSLGVSYDVYIQDSCENGVLTSWTGPVSFTLPAPSCDAPTAVFVDNISETTANVNWTSGGSNLWNVEYGIQGFTQGSGTVITTSSNPLQLTGLTPGTAYDVYVQDTCANVGVSSWSAVASFTSDSLASTCNVPNSLFASNLSDSSATLSWTSGGSSVWNIEFGISGFTQGSGTIQTVFGNPFTLHGLSPSTSYDFYVQDSCLGLGLSAWSVVNTFTTLATPCIAPSNLTSANVSSSSAEISWTSANAQNWNIEYGISGFTPGMGILLVANTNPFIITGLADSTSYDVYVQSNCGINSGLSTFEGPHTFTTLALPASSPALVIAQWNFNGTANNTNPPANIGDSISNAILIGGVSGSFASGAGSSDPDSPNSAWNTGSYATQGTEDRERGVRFDVNLTGFDSVIFSYDHRYSNTAANSTAIEYTLDNTVNPIVWQQAAVFTINAGNVWFNRNVDLTNTPGVANNPNFALRIVATFDSNGTQYSAANSTSSYGTAGTNRFDMVTFRGRTYTTPVCANPVNVGFNNVSETTANVTWNASASNAVNVEYGVAGFTQGSGTMLSAASGSLQLTALTPSTVYEVYLQNFCLFGGSSSVVGPFTFTTASPTTSCNMPTALLAGNVTTNSANISWQSGGSLVWNVEFGASGFVQGSGTLQTTFSQNTILTGLQPNTTYDVYVQDSCGGFGSSAWAGPLQFTTDTLACTPISNNVQLNGCIGDSVSFGASSYAVPGNYTITLTASNGCDSIINLELIAYALNQVSITGDTLVCEGSQAILFASQQMSHIWSTGDTSNTSSFVISSDTSIWVEGTDNNGCITSDTFNVQVIPAVAISFGTIAPLCESDSPLDLSFVTPQGGTFSGSGIVGNTFDPSISGFGSFTITYEIQSGGCTTIATTGILVNEVQPISWLSIGSLCLSDLPLTLTGASPFGGVYSGNEVQNGIFNPTAAGNYTVDYTSTNAQGCSASATQNVEVNENPTVDLGPDQQINQGTSITLSAGNPGATYAWSTGASTQNIVVGTTGTYSVTVTNASNCSASSSVNIDVISSVYQFAAEQMKVRIAPNPSNGQFALIVTGNHAESILVNILDINGRLVYDHQVLNANKEFVHEFDLSAFNSGIYFMQFVTDEYIQTERIIIR